MNAESTQLVLPSPQEYYSSHGPVTDPGAFGHLYRELPASLDGLCRVGHGLVIHLGGGELYGYTIPAEDVAESDTREVEAILARTMERDPQPLTVARPPERRFVGHCRVSAVLYCSMLRELGVPAVARAGFWGYHGKGPTVPSYDHWITEVWKQDEGRWVLVDPEQDEQWLATLPEPLDPLDIERHKFISPGQAWLACRRGEAAPENFGLDPSDVGMRYIRRQLLRDIAAFNKWESSGVDVWGVGLPEDDGLTADDLALLDHAAGLDAKGIDAYDELRRIYAAEPRLRPDGS